MTMNIAKAKMKEITARTPTTTARIVLVVRLELVAGAAEAVGGTGKTSFKSLPVTI